MKINHLYHSGILIETEKQQLFFDVISDVEAMIDASKSVFFFVSHAHGDHYAPEIFSYQSSRTNYIISNDVSCKLVENLIFVEPNQIYYIEEMEITTYESTDKGVSFIVKIEGKVIFHAGDLNWWHWENSTKEEQMEEEVNYKKIVDKIEDIYIDFAFIPVDPRLGEAYYYAAKYFLDTKKVGFMIPIHFRENFHICNKLSAQLGDDRHIVLVKSKNYVLDLGQ
jgi:L-ascorbate metabolism protein UlaG (beta-lactamase superfamily)